MLEVRDNGPSTPEGLLSNISDGFVEISDDEENAHYRCRFYGVDRSSV